MEDVDNQHTIELPLPKKADADFCALVSKVLDKRPAGNKPILPPVGMTERVLIAARRFVQSALHLSNAFVTRAITGQSTGNPSFKREDVDALREDIEDLLERLSWIEESLSEEVLEEARHSNLEEELAAAVLSTAVKLKILRRLSRYCQLSANSKGSLEIHMTEIKSLNIYYLDVLADIHTSKSKQKVG